MFPRRFSLGPDSDRKDKPTAILLPEELRRTDVTAAIVSDPAPRGAKVDLTAAINRRKHRAGYSEEGARHTELLTTWRVFYHV